MATEWTSPGPMEAWHYLQISDALDEEFTAALARRVPVVAWRPRMEPWAILGGGGGELREQRGQPGLTQWSFPLQRGYARAPMRWLARSGPVLRERLLRHTTDPGRTPLVCSTPYHAPVAELWPGPVIYYLTDLMVEYAGADAGQVRALDRRMCRVARAVCPNSTRIGEYLERDAGCAKGKITVVPNATRAANLLPRPLLTPGNLPADAAGMTRPVAGVIGNMGANVNWQLLRAMVEAAPEISWLMVGPVGNDVANPAELAAREALRAMGGRVRFVGRKPFGELAVYARSLDVAVLPYRLREPTFSGSSTRFYEHLAATRPILSTRGFEELLHKPPLLELFDTAEEGLNVLRRLAANRFDDGHMEARWRASQDGTWDRRAAAMMEALAQRS